MSVLPRAATSPELALLRSDNQSTRLYLTVHNPTTIYTARLAAVPASTDKVASITYNTGSGTLANVLSDMTLLVGSTAGAYDLGIARIRKDGTTLAGTFYIGEESEINWTSGAYLTVVDEFALWPRHVRIDTDGVTPLMDYDIAYTNQHTSAGAIPTPVMGPHLVAWLRGSSVVVNPDASNSWVYDGTIASYLWVAPGASGTGGMTTATPTLEYNVTGVYRVSLTVTGDNGVSFTGYRYVFVVTESAGVTTQFTLDAISGDYAQGGWSFRVTLYDEATRALIRDRALVILHSVDYYGNTRQSLGYVAGSENVIAVGRIAGESIVWGTEDKYGSVSFDVEGPQYWFGKMTAFPSGVKDVADSVTPNKWTKFKGLTLYKAWYHFMRWRSTATRCMDVYENTEHRRHKRLEAPGGENIWAQLIEIGKRSMLADPCCDRYGRIWLQVNQQFVANRSAMPVVQAITSQDWSDEIRFDRVTVNPVSLIDLSGTVWDGITVTPIFSLAPGHVFNEEGAVEVVDRLALDNTSPQASTNTLAGLYSAWRNNMYPRVDVRLASNHRLFDIVPYQRLTLAIAATDTPRGIAESLTLIPRSITYEYDNTLGVMLTSGTFEAEVTADLAVTGDTPPTPPPPPPGPVTPPPQPPPIDPGPGVDAKEVWMATPDTLIWSGDYFNGGQPTWNLSALPSGKQCSQFWMQYDGGVAYAYCYDMSSAALFKTTDPKSATPSWTDITPAGQVLHRSIIWKNFLITHLTDIGDNHQYADYDGTTWFYNTPSHDMIDFTEIAYRAFISHESGSPSGDAHYMLRAVGSEAALSADLVYNGAWSPWQNFMSGPRYMAIAAYNGEAARHVSIIRMDTGEVLLATGQLVPTFDTIEKPLRGAYAGPHLQYVDNSGAGWISDDGATFRQLATWYYGILEDAKWSGGGGLVWIPQTISANNVPTRLYDRLGGSVDMTGNFWSILSGGQEIFGVSLVF